MGIKIIYNHISSSKHLIRLETGDNLQRLQSTYLFFDILIRLTICLLPFLSYFAKLTRILIDGFNKSKRIPK